MCLCFVLISYLIRFGFRVVAYVARCWRIVLHRQWLSYLLPKCRFLTIFALDLDSSFLAGLQRIVPRDLTYIIGYFALLRRGIYDK